VGRAGVGLVLEFSDGRRAAAVGMGWEWGAEKK